RAGYPVLAEHPQRLPAPTNPTDRWTTPGDRSASQHDVVDVAPTSVLSGIERLDDGMVDGVKVLGRMAIFRVIAAPDVSARQAQSKVHPRVAGFQTLLAPLSRRGDLMDLIQVLACLRHTPSGGGSRGAHCTSESRNNPQEAADGQEVFQHGDDEIGRAQGYHQPPL